MLNLSVLVPVYNEEKILKDNTIRLYNHLNRLKVIKNFEILICDNGSKDRTFDIAKK